MIASATKPARRVSKEIANLRALAILAAIGDVLDSARAGRSWRAFELAWFVRRVGEARDALAHASAQTRADFAASLVETYESLRLDESALTGEAVTMAARAMVPPLGQLLSEMAAGSSERAPAEPRRERGSRTARQPRPSKPVRTAISAPMLDRILAMYREGGSAAALKADPLMRKLARAGLADYVGTSVWWLTPKGRAHAQRAS